MGNICKRCSSEDLADEPLIRAIRKGSFNGVKKCLRSKERVSATSALVEAAYIANEDILNLLAQTEDVNVRNSVGQTALLEVVAANKRTSAEALLKIGSDPNLRHDRTGDTPLLVATRNGYADIVGVLLEFSADVNCLNNEMSALMVACQLGFETILRLLIESEKCDVELANGQNENGLMFACSAGKLGAVLILISSGCNLNCVDANGMCALMRAAGGGHIEIVKLLVKNGAHVSTVDGSGRTAETHARKKGHSDIAMYLTELQARTYQNGVTENGSAVNPYTYIDRSGGDTVAFDVDTDGAGCTKDGALLAVSAISPCDACGILPPVEAAGVEVPRIGANNNVKNFENQRDLKQIVVTNATIDWGTNSYPCGTTHEPGNFIELKSFSRSQSDVSSAMSTLTSTSGLCDTPTGYDTPTIGICDTTTGCDTPTSGICDTPTGYDTPTSGICDTPTRDLSDVPTSARDINIIDVTEDNSSTPHNPGNRMLHSPLGGAQGCEDDKVESLTPVHEPDFDSKLTKNQQAKKIVCPMSKTFPRRKVPEWVKDEQHGNTPVKVDGREVNLDTPADAQKTKNDSSIHLVDNTSKQGKCHSKKRNQNKEHVCCKTIIITQVANIQEVNNVSINGNCHECCPNSSTGSDKSSDEKS